MARPLVVTFDIDGTILQSRPGANSVHKGAFVHAAYSMFPTLAPGHTIDDLDNHHGATDGIILAKFTRQFGDIDFESTRKKLPELFGMMAAYFDDHVDQVGNGLHVIPGVRNALRYLVANGVKVGLVTGNVESIAWQKMRIVGLEPPEYFSEPRFGGFGTDVVTSGTDEEAKIRDRGDQITIAMRKAAGDSSANLDARVDVEEPPVKRTREDVSARCFHIGDAPPDVLAAAWAGVTPIGVATGKYTMAELKEACPTAHVLESLEDLDKFLCVLGLGSKLSGTLSSNPSSSGLAFQAILTFIT